MKAAAFVVVCVFVLGLGPACSSSSSTPVGSGSDAGHDTGASEEDAPEEATVAAAASCDGLDAATQGLTFPATCEACIAVHCCTDALACAMASGCKQIEECAATCVAGGTAAQTCAEHCIAQDASTAHLSAGQNAAETLDLCLASNCSSVCS